MKRHLALALAALAVLPCPVSFAKPPAPTTTTTTTLESRSTAGKIGNGASSSASHGEAISDDGNLVVFESNATNFAPDDPGAILDIYVRNRSAKTTTLVSRKLDGTADTLSRYAQISADGTHVAYVSRTGLTEDIHGVPNDTNEVDDIVLTRLADGFTELVTVSSSGWSVGGTNNDVGIFSLSADGRYVAFSLNRSLAGEAASPNNVYVRDMLAGNTVLVTGNGRWPRISANGQYVSYVDSNNSNNAYACDWQSASPTPALVTVTIDGSPANGQITSPAFMSADGRYVAFSSLATNLVAGDLNGVSDAFLHDRSTGSNTIVSVSSTGAQSFISNMTRVNDLSADGQYVLFDSNGTDLVSTSDTNNAEDIFVHEVATGKTVAVSVSSGGKTTGDWGTAYGSISSNGRCVTFGSMATNLVTKDTNATYDAFVNCR